MAAERGASFGDGARACPFVALELDRDRRADRPDYRHRCFAEPTPAPRSIAHQEAYCLSPNFSACPIFQDWAVRAAARPVDGGSRTTTSHAGEGAAAAGLTGAAASAAMSADEPGGSAEPGAEEPPAVAFTSGTGGSERGEMEQVPAEPASAPDEPADEAPWPPASDWAVDPEPEPPASGEAEQLGVFDARPSDSIPAEREPDIPPPPRGDGTAQGDYDDDALAEAEEPPVPEFLAGRTPPTPPSTTASSPPSRTPPHPEPIIAPAPPRAERVRREDVVPSWEIDGRFGAEPPPADSDDDRFGGLVTTIAVVLILALGVAAVIFLPGLLAGGGPSPTAAPSVPVQSALPSFAPTVAITPTVAPTSEPTQAPPTATPAPVASPRTYRIRAGDTLRRIARRFDTTVEEILALNPEIEDPNQIQVGQVILVPAAPE